MLLGFFFSPTVLKNELRSGSFFLDCCLASFLCGMIRLTLRVHLRQGLGSVNMSSSCGTLASFKSLVICMKSSGIGFNIMCECKR